MKMTIKLFTAAAVLLAACTTQPASQKADAPTLRTEVKYEAEIALLKPDTVGGLTIDAALWNRRSSRAFSAEALSLEELSGVVWAAAGINRSADDHLTAPSALGLYPIRTYVFLPGGVYRYEARNSKLVRVAEGDHRAAAGQQLFVATAPLNLVFMADLSAYEGRNIPAEHVRYLCGQDAAGYAENANLYAAGHGLKSVTRGSAPEAELLGLLGLDPGRYFFALAVSVGK